MRTITNAELIAAAQKFFDEGRLTQQAKLGCWYSRSYDGVEYRCAIGAALTDDEIKLILEKDCNEATVKKLMSAGVFDFKFEDVAFAEKLQVAHDEMLNKIIGIKDFYYMIDRERQPT